MPKIDAHRIAPKLWVGSAPEEDACRVFDVVVLCAEEYQPALSCAVYVGFNDTQTPSTRDVKQAVRAAKVVAAERAKGKRVLVTCAAGVNRSALVAAMALLIEGSSARSAIRALRKHRKPPNGMTPLRNRAFVRLLVQMERLRKKPWPTASTTQP